MRFHGIACFDCQNLDKFNDLTEEEVDAIERYSVELRDDLMLRLTCPNGHKSVLCLQQRKFELLFDLGAMALLDGYSREAVSSFAAAYERFLEFCIRVLLRAREVPRDAFHESWKVVSNQSERQLGAFLFLFLQTFSKPAPVFDNTQVAFRNKAIHKGYIPAGIEVCAYAEYTYNYIHDVMRILSETLDAQIKQVDMEDVSERQKAAEAEGRVVICGVATILNTHGNFGHESLNDGLARLKEKRWLKP